MRRFLLAEALLAQGRHEEARTWFQTLVEYPNLSTWPVYLPPALYKLGVCNEALGEYDQALADYRDFVAFWEDADPELQPIVEDARAAIERVEQTIDSGR